MNRINMIMIALSAGLCLLSGCRESVPESAPAAASQAEQSPASHAAPAPQPEQREPESVPDTRPPHAELSEEQRRVVAELLTDIIAQYESGEMDTAGEQVDELPSGVRLPQHLMEELGSGVSSFGVYRLDDTDSVFVSAMCSAPDERSFLQVWLTPQPGEEAAYTVERIAFSPEAFPDASR